MSDFRDVNNMLTNLIRYIKEDVPEIVGTEAVNHFQESFQNQGFTDSALKKWPEVKRRKASSGWYGFKLGATSAKPGQKKRKKESKTNFSPAATKRPILSGETQELLNSIKYTVNGNRVTISSDKKYAQIHNEGGKMKVFGKASAKMPKRQFMGNSAQLRNKILSEIAKDISKIVK